MAKANNKHEDFINEVKDFKSNLMFEDPGTVMNKAYKWLNQRDDIQNFGVDVNMKTSEVNAYVKFSKEDVIAVTLFN